MRLLRSEGFIAVVFFLVVANVFYAPYVWGHLTLLSSAREAASIYPSGAGMGPGYAGSFKGFDAGAPAWQTEPGFKVIHDQLLGEHVAPLWNPYEAFGAPLAGAMQEQPFYPLAALVSLHPTPHTYNLFVIGRLLFCGIFAFFFLRFFAAWPAAYAAGMCAMFMGYLLLFYNMPEVSVESAISFLFFSIELHLRKRAWYSTVALALAVWLTIVGGMPESTMLVLTFACLYALARICTRWRAQALRSLVDFCVPVAAGVLCSGIVLLPSLEFIRHSYNTHELRYTGVPQGLAHATFGSDAFPPYLMPLIFGPPTQNIMTNFAGYAPLIGFFGVIPLFLAFVAVVCACVELRKRRDTNGVVVFFAIATACLIAKRYGLPAINWIGILPLFNMIQFTKYEEVLTGFSMAVLAGLGLDRLMRPDRPPRAIVIAGSLALAFTAVTLLSTLPLGAWGTSHSEYYFGNLAGGLFLALATFGVWLALARTSAPSTIRNIGLFVLCALFVEVTCQYFVPVYYAITPPATDGHNPYADAPYVRFLQRSTPELSRVYGIEDMLFPNWAGAYGLFDVRGLDGVYYDRYLPFVRAFFPAKRPPSGDLYTRFNGDIGFDPASKAEQRFFSLSSVKFIIAGNRVAQPLGGAYRLAYKGDAHVYEFAHPFPRAVVFHAVRLAPNDEAALRALTASDFDITRTAVVETDGLGESGASAIKLLPASAPSSYDGATIVAYRSQDVTVRTNGGRAGLLVLNDSNYPGWNAYVDGRKAAVLKTNYLFRGVLIPAGAHEVEFRYEPLSFRIGGWLGILGLGTIALYAFTLLRRPPES
jgi:hypothetical protein